MLYRMAAFCLLVRRLPLFEISLVLVSFLDAWTALVCTTDFPPSREEIYMEVERA